MVIQFALPIALVKLSSKVGFVDMQTSKASLLACHSSSPLDDPYPNTLVKLSSNGGNAQLDPTKDNNLINLLFSIKGGKDFLYMLFEL